MPLTRAKQLTRAARRLLARQKTKQDLLAGLVMLQLGSLLDLVATWHKEENIQELAALMRQVSATCEAHGMTIEIRPQTTTETPPHEPNTTPGSPPPRPTSRATRCTSLGSGMDAPRSPDQLHRPHPMDAEGRSPLVLRHA